MVHIKLREISSPLKTQEIPYKELSNIQITEQEWLIMMALLRFKIISVLRPI